MLDSSREFIVLAACLNYTKAARKLNVSQSSLSRHIADLEKELGVTLLERNPLALTKAGRYYLETASDVIERLDAGIERSRAIAQEDCRDLSIYMLPVNSLYSSIVYEGVARMRLAPPGPAPRFCYTDREHSALDAVVSGKADVGVLLSPPDVVPDGFACERLADSPAVVWLHEDNPLAHAPSLSLEDLSGCFLVRSTTQSSDTWFEGVVDVFRRHGLKPKYRVRDLENKESFFLTLRPDEVLLASDEGETTCRCNPRLVCRRIEGTKLAFSTHLLHKERPDHPLVGRFVETCRRVAEEMAAR